MSRRICGGLSRPAPGGGCSRVGLGFIGLFVLVLTVPASAAPGDLSGVVAWVASDFFDDAATDWNLGMGFNLNGTYELNRTLDLRGDWGVRWADGEGPVLRNARSGPDFGGRIGETNDGIRVMPFTVDLVYRFEDWSRGRYWLPFAGAGLGFYDISARFLDPDGLQMTRNLYRFGWNLRGGVQLHRTSGMFITLESALHLVDIPQQWTPQYDIGIGIGAFLPGR